MRRWSTESRGHAATTPLSPSRSGGRRFIHFARLAADGIRAICDHQDAATDWTTIAGVVTCPVCRSLLRRRAAGPGSSLHGGELDVLPARDG